jgi:RNAse (barnase) inhibitor barstar
MRRVEIDCAGVISESAFWQRYLDDVQPDGADLFGRNLNAFWDAVEADGPGWPGDVVLVFKNSARLAALWSGDEGATFLAHLKAIATEVSVQKIIFA